MRQCGRWKHNEQLGHFAARIKRAQMSKNVYGNVPLDVSDRTRKKWGRITKSKNERGRSRKKRMRGREISSTDVFFIGGVSGVVSLIMLQRRRIASEGVNVSFRGLCGPGACVSRAGQYFGSLHRCSRFGPHAQDQSVLGEKAGWRFWRMRDEDWD